MTPEKLSVIVTARGGVKSFALLIDTLERTIYGRLDVTRRIRPTIAAFIRTFDGRSSGT